MNKITSALPPGKTGKKTYGPNAGGGLSRIKSASALTASDGGATSQRDEKPFDSMNNLVANMLLNMTRYRIQSRHLPATFMVSFDSNNMGVIQEVFRSEGKKTKHLGDEGVSRFFIHCHCSALLGLEFL